LGGKPGNFTYHLNNGTANNPAFNSSPNNAFWGAAETINENISNFGYSSPVLIEKNQGLYLFSGSEEGKIFIWEINVADINAPFALIDSTFLNIDPGTYAAPAFGDLNNDGFIDMIIGNKRGGINFYKGLNPSSIKTVASENQLNIYPNPATTTIRIKSNNKIESITITDLSGKLIQQVNTIDTSDFYQLNTAHLVNGFYFIQVKTDVGISTEKLIIQKNL